LGLLEGKVIVEKMTINFDELFDESFLFIH